MSIGDCLLSNWWTDEHRNASAQRKSTIHNKNSKGQKLVFSWWNWKAKLKWSSWNKERQNIWYWGSKKLYWSRLVQNTLSRLVTNRQHHIADDVWSLVHHSGTLEVFNDWEHSCNTDWLCLHAVTQLLWNHFSEYISTTVEFGSYYTCAMCYITLILFWESWKDIWSTSVRPYNHS